MREDTGCTKKKDTRREKRGFERAAADLIYFIQNFLII
jgi:hypothetical protein